MIKERIAAQTGMNCSVVETINHLPKISKDNKQTGMLVLYDCRGMGLDELQNLLYGSDSDVFSLCLVAFFNLSSGLEIEDIALGCGVRGFFYEDSTAASLLKGVDVLFSGDYWVSRQKIINCLALGRGRKSNISKERTAEKILTTREIEILTMIAMGGSNGSIADRLCISRHTVRTHVYNIFKKIDVPSRLQASLWAAKHL